MFQSYYFPLVSGTAFRRLACLLCVLGFALGSQQARGQVIPDTTRLLSASSAVLAKQYAQVFMSAPQLYNGPEYVDYAKRYHASIGHQYFQTVEKQLGSVFYNNHYFPDLLLNYDVVFDQVVLQHATSPLTLRLLNPDVRYFTLGPHRFVRLEADSTAPTTFRTGYYELLVDSHIQLVAKRAKRMQDKINQRAVDVEFSPINKLFVKKAGTYYPVSNKRSITRLFADHSREVQQYIQDNKLKFKKDTRENDIVQVTRYYAGLRPQ